MSRRRNCFRGQQRYARIRRKFSSIFQRFLGIFFLLMHFVGTLRERTPLVYMNIVFINLNCRKQLTKAYQIITALLLLQQTAFPPQTGTVSGADLTTGLRCGPLFAAIDVAHSTVTFTLHLIQPKIENK